jgi:hypothetical protein
MLSTLEGDDSSAKRPYTLAEKQKFWADLDRLPELAQDSDEEHLLDDDGVQEAVKSHEIRHDPSINSRTHATVKSKVSNSRKRTCAPPKNPRKPPFQPGRPSLSRRSRSDKSAVTLLSAIERTSLSSPLHPTNLLDDAPRPWTAGFAPPTPVSPPVLRRVQIDQPKARPKQSRGKKGKQISVPESEGNLLDSLHLFSVPNSDSNPVQTKQMQYAVARGASWSRSWAEPVTHVVIFSDLHIERASREFEGGRLPEGIPVVKDSWLVECMKFKEVQDSQCARFLVPGMKSAFELEKADADDEKGRASISSIFQPESRCTPSLRDKFTCRLLTRQLNARMIRKSPLMTSMPQLMLSRKLATYQVSSSTLMGMMMLGQRTILPHPLQNSHPRTNDSSACK